MNSTVLICGLSLGFYEFVIKADANDNQIAENTYRKIKAIHWDGPFLMEYFFNEPDLKSIEANRWSEDKKFVLSLDKALAYYTEFKVCLDVGRCDAEMAHKFLCAAVLEDALVINRTVVADIVGMRGFMDRTRIWQFYALLETCTSYASVAGDLGHSAFLSRFEKQIKFMDKMDRALSRRLKKAKNRKSPEAANAPNR